MTRQSQVPDAVTLMRQAGYPPDPWQQQVLQSGANRLLLLCCRQSGKSTTVSILGLHTALSQPGSLVLLLSPSLRQSSELFRKTRESVWRLDPALIGALTAESALRLELSNGSRIISLPGTEGTVRGFSGVRLLVIDEAARVSDELYYSVRPMLAVSGGRLVVLSTPWGKRGWFFQEWAEGQGWEQIKITAHECPRISPEFLEEERRTMPPLWFDSEYLCRFVDTTDQVFSSEHVLAALSSEVLPLFAGGAP